MPELWGTKYTRAQLVERLGDLRQLADVRPFEYTDGLEGGTRGVSLRNAAERASDRLQFLQPGEVRCYAIEVEFFEPGRDAQ
jgi:hypothetical protein